MIRAPSATTITDDQVSALLMRYDCPVPFHEVRTRFLGSIATPNMATSPMKVIGDLWGGELPEFEGLEEANELIGALMGGLWNRLTAHQHRSSPFRLTPTDPGATRDGLKALALMRQQEIDGFIDGLFGKEQVVHVPDRANRALDELGQMRALFAATVEIATDETRPGTIKDMETTYRRLREMTRSAEREIQAIVIACRIARAQLLAGLPANRPTVH